MRGSAGFTPWMDFWCWAEGMLPRLRSGDLLLTLGAGDITQVGNEVLGRLAKA